MADKSKYGSQSDGNTSESGNQNDTEDYKALYEQALKDLEKKDKDYTGLQRTVQTKDDALKEAQQKLSELTTNFGNTQKQLETLTTEKETLAGTLDEKEIALATSQTAATRAKLIMKEFPELAIFEAKELLPQTGPDDDETKLKELFGNFKTTMESLTGAQAKKKVDDLMSGASPKQPDSSAAGMSPNGSNPANVHLDLATAASLKGDVTTYDKEYALYQQEKYKGQPIENTQ